MTDWILCKSTHWGHACPHYKRCANVKHVRGLPAPPNVVVNYNAFVSFESASSKSDAVRFADSELAQPRRPCRGLFVTMFCTARPRVSSSGCQSIGPSCARAANRASAELLVATTYSCSWASAQDHTRCKQRHTRCQASRDNPSGFEYAAASLPPRPGWRARVRPQCCHDRAELRRR